MGDSKFITSLKQVVKSRPIPTIWARAAMETAEIIRRNDRRQRLVRRDKQTKLISITHPWWQGVSSATQGQGGDVLYLPECGFKGIPKAVRAILRGGYTHVVLNGFWYGYDRLCIELKKRRPDISIFYVHHGSFTQMGETFDGPIVFARIVELHEMGVFERIGFVKAGMDSVLKHFGVKSQLVLNRVPSCPKRPPRIWPEHATAFLPSQNSLRKNNHTQVLAALLSPEISRAVALDLDLSYLPENCEALQKLELVSSLTREETMDHVANANVVIYVTLSECAPMIVLESLTAGTPCITGATHGLFDGYPFLEKNLIVRVEDDVEAIVRGIHRVRENYTELCDTAQEFATEYDRHAAEVFDQFLGLEGEGAEDHAGAAPISLKAKA